VKAEKCDACAEMITSGMMVTSGMLFACFCVVAFLTQFRTVPFPRKVLQVREMRC
jgi:hypothetical protein